MDSTEHNDGWVEGNCWDWTSVPAGAGVLAITSKSTGRSYYLAVRDLRQRAYDAHRMLVLGVHHNPELQTAFSAAPDDFEFAAVEHVSCLPLLGMFKACWIERSGTNCFNRKSAVRHQHAAQRGERYRMP